MSDKTKVAVLVSGGGTNLQALIDKIAAGELPEAEIVEVISSKEGTFALERAARAGIPTAVAKSQADVLAELKRSGAEMIVRAGYMKVLSPEIIENYRNRIINIHPSLIPKYCGKGFYGMRVHQAVIAGGLVFLTVLAERWFGDGDRLYALVTSGLDDSDTVREAQRLRTEFDALLRRIVAV